VMSVVKPLQDRMLDAADVIFVGSEPMIDASPVLARFKGKCTVLPYPVSSDRLLPSPEYRSEHQPDVGKPIVLFVGRLVYYKGVEYLIRAIKDVDAHLIIAGDGPLRSSLEKLANTLGVTERVSFKGNVTDQELGALYRMASVFVLPSVESAEAFGLVQVEAMLHGVPVVNTWLPTGVPSVSLDGKTGFTVLPRDPSALAVAINRILVDPLLRASFSASAKQRSAEYSPARVLAQLRGVYHHIIESTQEQNATHIDHHSSPVAESAIYASSGS
jgi:glycosyltransferase involved in cell wall biosynthesis